MLQALDAGDLTRTQFERAKAALDLPAAIVPPEPPTVFLEETPLKRRRIIGPCLNFKNGICWKGQTCTEHHNWCRHAGWCTKNECGFRHPWDKVLRCKFGRDCNDAACEWTHPPTDA